MPLTAPIYARDPQSYVPRFTLTPVTGAELGTVVSTAVAGIQYSVTTYGSDFSAYDLTQSVPQFNADWSLSTETPGICTVAAGRVTRVTAGDGKIRATGPAGFSTVYTVPFGSVSAPDYVWTGFGGTTLSSRLSEPILALLLPGKQIAYYGANFTQNSQCWAYPLDLTGSAVSTSYGGQFGTANSGALITPQHSVGVAHFGSGADNMGPGATAVFRGSDGLFHSRTVLRRDYNATKDRIVILWDSPLPATVQPFKLAGTTMMNLLGQRFLGMGWQMTQEKHVTPVGFDDFTLDYKSLRHYPAVTWDSTFTKHTAPLHRLHGLSAYLQRGRIGDSGGAIGGYYNGQTYLVSLFGEATSGQLYSSHQAAELNSILAGLDAAQGISTGYQVGILEIT